MNEAMAREKPHNGGTIHFVLTERFLKPDGGRWSLVEQALRPLNGLENIAHAHVILEQGSSDSRYRAIVWLAMPVADLHADESGPAIESALHKAVARLEEQLRGRIVNRTDRRNSLTQTAAAAGT